MILDYTKKALVYEVLVSENFIHFMLVGFSDMRTVADGMNEKGYTLTK